MHGLRARQRVLATDSVVAVGVTGLVLAGVIGWGADPPLTDDQTMQVDPGVPGLALLCIGTLALAFRRLAPVPVLVVNGATFIAYQGLDYRPPPLPLGLIIALFTVALMRRPLVSAGVTGVVLAVIVSDAVIRFAPLTDDQLYVDVISIGAAILVGYGVQLEHTRARLAEQGAARIAREQDLRTQAAVQQEQARIARELHDIVAHDMSVVVAQAGAARRVFDDRPDAVREALAAIETLGRDAMQGMRQLVGLLRAQSGQEDRSPQPGLDGLPALLHQVEHAGVTVELVVAGDTRPLPAAVELNAYRIVQEALTNTVRHAGPTRATLALRYEDDALQVTVTDAGGGGTPATGRGYGLLGMQQRVAALGGELRVGPKPGCGFLVSARLPLGGA